MTILLAGFLLHRFAFQPQPLPPTGGQAATILIPTPHFQQADPRWADDILGNADETQSTGGTGGTLKSEGCTVCCAAMALTALSAHSKQGQEITPGELNQKLSQNNGFTKQGWLIWSALSDIAGPNTTIQVKSRFTHDEIDACLHRNQPVIAKVLYLGHIWHWVLIVGKEGQHYLIHDPLSPKAPLLAKDRYADGFHAIRYFQPK